MRRYLQPAHTLIELLVVITIIALIAAIAGTSHHFIHRTFVRAEVEKLRTICTYLQQRAMASGSQCRLQFDRTTNSYRFDDEKHILPPQVQFGVLSGVKGPPSSPSHQLTSPITFEKDQILFQPDGIFKPGTVYLVGKDSQTLYALSVGIGTVSYMRTYCYTGRWNPLL